LVRNNASDLKKNFSSANKLADGETFSISFSVNMLYGLVFLQDLFPHDIYYKNRDFEKAL